MALPMKCCLTQEQQSHHWDQQQKPFRCLEEPRPALEVVGKCNVTNLWPVECEDFGVLKLHHSFVIVPECPLNLPSRDFLRALGLAIVSTENDLALKKSDSADEPPAVMICYSPTCLSCNYCWNIDPSSFTQELYDFVKAHRDAQFEKHEQQIKKGCMVLGLWGQRGFCYFAC